MKKNNYDIDIIMGVYNCENYLCDSLDSIINQTFKNWRLIICDDGSKDDTYKILKKYKNRLKEKIILLKNKKNKGLNYTLNKCIMYSNARYIARMDGDDTCDKERLKKEYQFLEMNSEYSFVSCDASLYDENGIWGHLGFKKAPTNIDFLKISPFIHAAVLIRSNDLKKVGSYSVDDRLLRVEDYHLWFKLYSIGLRGYNIKEELYNIRDDRNATKRRNWKNRVNEFYVRKIGYKMLNLPWYYNIYCFRPIILGILPKGLYEKLHKLKLKEKK